MARDTTDLNQVLSIDQIVWLPSNQRLALFVSWFVFPLANKQFVIRLPVKIFNVYVTDCNCVRLFSVNNLRAGLFQIQPIFKQSTK